MTQNTIEMDMTRDYGIRENKLPNGEQLAIFRVANTALYQIAHAGNGKPVAIGDTDKDKFDSLTGMWTVPARAQEAITKYLETVWDRVKSKPVDVKPLSNETLTARSDREHKVKA